jgi:hypothetical protein
MKPKFEELHIGQRVWAEGKEREITGLSNTFTEQHYVYFDHDVSGQNYTKVDISLEPPKQKKKFWQWKVKYSKEGAWQRPDTYLNDLGMATNGVAAWKDWQDLDKVKIENDFVEVEV